MIPSNLERQEFIRFCQNLPILEPFLSHSGSTQEEAEHLAAFINEFLPVHQLLLVRLTSQGMLKDSASWEEAGGQAEGLCPAFSRAGLETLIAEVWAGQLPEDTQLEELLPQMMDGCPLPCHPTLLPIYFNGALTGFAIFGKHLECGAWTAEEKELLSSLLQILGISFANQNYNDEFTLQRWVFNAVMDHMSANLYVTDIETDKILFMNKSMKKTFGVEHPEGQLCYKVLQSGMEKRCPFCPVDSLRAKAAQQDGPVSCAWEERNTLTGRVYENYDSLMNWTDGSVVHFQQSVDITDSIELTKVASTDELTDMLNRRAGKLAMGNALQNALDGSRPLVICMYDVNDLKTINDNFGHVTGDFLLRTVSGVMKETVGDAGFCFRLSGDEFIIVLERTGFAEAQSMMYRARQSLCSLQKERGLPYEIGFCYGLIETAPDKAETVRELLMRADEKMYEHKRRYHIEKSTRALEEKGAAPDQMIPFDYDKDLLYDALVQSTEDYIYICNMKTNVFRYSKAMVEEFDLPGEVIENAAAVWGAKVHDDDKQAFLNSNQEIVDGRTDCHSVEYRAKNRRGEWVWVRCRGHVERNEKGEPVLFAGMITNLAKKNKIDHVTGLFDKFVFEDDLRALLQSETRNPIGIMTLGLDDFKHINDLYNREFGDEVIRISSQKIQSLLPINSAIYRLDGDEFGILVRDASPSQMQKLYESIQSVFSHQQEYNGNKYYCSISAGCTLYPKDGSTYYNLRKYAGYSLEYAKTHGKNRLVHYSPDLLVEKTQQLYLTELLRGSVEHGFEGFELHYQVQVDAETGACKGAEALARWHCDEYGAVRPDIFIPLLEASGMILPVGKWIFKAAVQTCAAWIKLHPPFTMSINLSYLQLTDPTFLPFMEKTLKEEGVPPSHIIAELTESYIASSIGTLSHVFQQIRSLGIRIAMDDFGTGYSSLGILKNAPADIVKIDRGFVQGIKNSTFDLTFIKFVVELCHTVNIRVCVEGVETEEEYAIVRALHPDFIQGFLFGRPETTEHFRKNQLDAHTSQP